MKKLFVLALLVSVLLGGCSAPETPSVLSAIEVTAEALHAPLADESFAQLETLSDPVQPGLLREIRGCYTDQPILSARDAVCSLGAVRHMMSIESFDFAPLEEEDRGDRRVYVLQQLYCGLPVSGAIFYVTADNEGRAMSVRGTYTPNIRLSTEPVLTSSEAKKAAQPGKGEKIDTTQLEIYADTGNPPRLSWTCSVRQRGLIVRKIYVDAVTGEILSSTPLLTP